MTMVPAAGLSWRSRPAGSGKCSVALTRVAAGLFVGLPVALAAGCSNRHSLAEPSFSPSEAAQRAIAQYDKNGDGSLDAKELEQCPPLKSALKELDKNKDGKVSAEEIAKRLEEFQESHAALISVACRVKLDGNPLAGATVTLVPEAFLGPSFKPARGVSDASGSVKLQTEGQEFAGVSYGYYRIEVSKKDGAGREALPARYNAQTTLGREVAPTSRSGTSITLNLTSS